MRRRWHRFMIACYDKVAAKTAEMMDKDPDDTEDVWLLLMVDLDAVVAVRESYRGEDGTWIHLSTGECMRVNAHFETVAKIVAP